MPPANNAFGGGAAETLLGPSVLILMVVAIGLVFVIPRRFVLAPLMFAIFLAPVSQSIVLGGAHLFVSRILILAGLIRAITSRQSGKSLIGVGFTRIDKIFIDWMIYRASAFILTYHGETGAVVNQVGYLWDSLGGYFLMRFLIRDEADVHRTIKILLGVAVVLSLTMLYEKFRDFNVYGLLAGSPLIPEIRRGSIRAQGPFRHAILAGCFGATLLPLFFLLYRNKKDRLLAVVGMLASAAITFASASSTPASAFVGGILATCLWPLRRSMRLVRWALVIGILLLDMNMHAPAWYVLEHIDLAGGSAGQHRAELVGNFITHFSDWWLIGTKDNASWGFEMWDISNQYVAEGELGGLVSFVCMIAVITLIFKKIGSARKSARGNPNKEWYFWLLGAAFFSHIMAFFGISYFDQTVYSWYALVAMIIVSTRVRSQGQAPAPQSSLELGATAPPHEIAC
ncbi:MAG: hypothetical protein WA239_08555 [Candidatus Sulfotelmatobacter sp.]